MSDENDWLKMHISYGGSMSYDGTRFSYTGGETDSGLIIDPDLLTWSIFEDFMKTKGFHNTVEQVWYKLPGEDISKARSIYNDKDVEIQKLCEETKGFREVYVYIYLMVDEGAEADFEDNQDDEIREEESESENENIMEPENEFEEQQSEGEDQLLGEGDVDTRFGDLLRQAERFSQVPEPVANDGGDSDSESEDERLLGEGEYPDSLVDTDEEWANFNKEDDKVQRKKRKEHCNYEKPPYLWFMQTFATGEAFKDQLVRYVLKTQFDVKLNRWESTKLAAVCTHEDCKWKIYCSFEKPINKWMVKVYEDKHNHLPTGRVRILKQGVIAKLFKEEARRRPDIKSTDIKDELMHMYNVSVSIFKCRKARRVALDMVLETQKQQFAKLWDYEAELLRSNKDTTTEIVTIEKDEKKVFDKFYVCFAPLKKAWKKCCRRMIGLDGAFLKWELKGEILSAVGRDAENRIYPIAWAVVRGENTESWEWFIKKLQVDLELCDGTGYSFISDRQKGLQIAMGNVLPNAEHRNCARHVYANWKKTYGTIDYVPFFWNVAYSRTLGEYELHMEELRIYDREAHDSLLVAEPKSWCRAFFSPSGRSNNVCNNLSESFNKTIKKARELPLINMLEDIRRQVMMRIRRRYLKARNCLLPFPEKIAAYMEKNRVDSKHCQVITSCDNLFEVVLYGCSFEVSLRLRHCACRSWDLSGIPCIHTIRVINDAHLDPANYIDFYYKHEVWLETFTYNVSPVNGEIYWPKTGKEPIGVPGFRKMPGRPKKKRIKAAHESKSNPNKATREGRTITCHNCKQVGHNRATCDNAYYVVEGPKRKPGRPPKINVEQDLPPRRRPRRTTPHVPSATTPSVPSATTPSVPSATTPSVPSATTPSAPSEFPIASTAPEGSSGRGHARGHARGRPRGRGHTRRESVPRGHGVYISPFTDRVFEVWENRARGV